MCPITWRHLHRRADVFDAGDGGDCLRVRADGTSLAQACAKGVPTLLSVFFSLSSLLSYLDETAVNVAVVAISSRTASRYETVWGYLHRGDDLTHTHIHTRWYNSQTGDGSVP